MTDLVVPLIIQEHMAVRAEGLVWHDAGTGDAEKSHDSLLFALAWTLPARARHLPSLPPPRRRRLIQKPCQLMIAGGPAELGQSLGLDLADPLPTQVQLPTDGLQRQRFAVVQPKARPQNIRLARRQNV